MRQIFHESDNKYTFAFLTSVRRSSRLWDSVTKYVFLYMSRSYFSFFAIPPFFYLSNKGVIVRESVEKRRFKNTGSLYIDCLSLRIDRSTINNLIRLRHISGTCSHYHARNTAHDDIIKFIMGNRLKEKG